jgi:hypothetical protein
LSWWSQLLNLSVSQAPLKNTGTLWRSGMRLKLVFASAKALIEFSERSSHVALWAYGQPNWQFIGLCLQEGLLLLQTGSNRKRSLSGLYCWLESSLKHGLSYLRNQTLRPLTQTWKKACYLIMPVGPTHFILTIVIWNTCSSQNNELRSWLNVF